MASSAAPWRPTSGSTSWSTPRTPTRSRRPSPRAGSLRSRATRRDPAGRVRPAALRPRDDHGDDPPGGRHQRARGQLHQGLLHRPGDRRPPSLPGQAEPPPARPAPLGAGRPRVPSSGLGERELGTVGTAVLSPAHGPIALAILRREAEPGATVEVRFGRGSRSRRRSSTCRSIRVPLGDVVPGGRSSQRRGDARRSRSACSRPRRRCSAPAARTTSRTSRVPPARSS